MNVWHLVLCVVILALAYILFQYARIRKLPEGTDEMQAAAGGGAGAGDVAAVLRDLGLHQNHIQHRDPPPVIPGTENKQKLSKRHQSCERMLL